MKRTSSAMAPPTKTSGDSSKKKSDNSSPSNAASSDTNQSMIPNLNTLTLTNPGQGTSELDAASLTALGLHAAVPESQPKRSRRFSGKYNAAVWKAILEDDDQSNVLNFDFDEKDNAYDDIYSTSSTPNTDFKLDMVYSDNLIRPSILKGSVSEYSTASPIVHVESIMPCGITLSGANLHPSDPKSDKNKSKSTNSHCHWPLSCCLNPKSTETTYNKSKSKFALASTLVDKYYSKLVIDFNAVEWELNFESPVPPKFSEELNAIGAQIWFVALALNKHFIQLFKVSSEDQEKFQSIFHSIVQDTVSIVPFITSLESVLTSYRKIGLTSIGELKKALTGRSDTDLADDKIGNEIFISTAAADLEGKKSTNLNILSNRVVQYEKPKMSSSTVSAFHRNHEMSAMKCLEIEGEDLEIKNLFDGLFSQPDTLKERKRLDIFTRNVTKIGWINFENQFTTDKKLVVEEDILTQAKHSLRALKKLLPKLFKKLKAGSSDEREEINFLEKLAPCYQPITCIPWILKMEKCITKIVEHDDFSPTDYEILRLQILTTEVHLENIISKGIALKSKISNIVSVVQLCCDFLANANQFHVLNYSKLRPNLYLEVRATRINPERKGKARSSVIQKYLIENIQIGKKEQAQVDDVSFFLNEYAMALKEVPISLGLNEFLLVNRVDARQRHSGVNFDGPRYLNVIH